MPVFGESSGASGQEWFARTQWVFVVYNLTDTRRDSRMSQVVENARHEHICKGPTKKP